jgi:hypothetical protein
MNLLAKSCFVPGIISLIGNLIKSAGDEDMDIELDWMKEYMQGMGHEIYRVQLSPKFERKRFSEISALIYKELQAICFGLELKLEGQTLVILNPGSYEIKEKDTSEHSIHVYVICEDKKVADQVSTYELSQEQIQQWIIKNMAQKDDSPKDLDEEEHGEGMIRRYIDGGQNQDKEEEQDEEAFTPEDLLELDYIL